MLSSLLDWALALTADNGKEFAFHKQSAERLGADFFFIRPTLLGSAG
ncbi:MAG: hypothetical protein ACYYK0_04340 [Candidatus Eutrophobiaceae bacterium]